MNYEIMEAKEKQIEHYMVSRDIEYDLGFLRLELLEHQRYINRFLKRIVTLQTIEEVQLPENKKYYKSIELPDFKCSGGITNWVQYKKYEEEYIDELIMYECFLEKDRIRQIEVTEYIAVLRVQLKNQKKLIRDLYHIARKKKNFVSLKSYEQIIELLKCAIMDVNGGVSKDYQEKYNKINQMIKM